MYYDKIINDFELKLLVKPENENPPSEGLIKIFYNDLQYIIRQEMFLGDELISYIEYEYYDDYPKFQKKISIFYNDSEQSANNFSVTYSKPVYNSEGYYIDSFESNTEDWSRSYHSIEGKILKGEQFTQVDGSFVISSSRECYQLSDFIDLPIATTSDITVIGNYMTPFYYTIYDDEFVVCTAMDMDTEYTFSKSFLSD